MRKINKYVQKIKHHFFCNKKETWKDIEYFNESWKERIKKMSDFINPSEAVMDLGCGKLWLRDFLSASNKYYPVDYISRSSDTIVVDFNKNQFPDLKVDVVFASGVLEYINNPEWFVKKISDSCNKCILSYCTTEYNQDTKMRRSYTWVNDFTFNDIVGLFKKNNMKLMNSVFLETNNNTIFVFTKN